MQRVVRLAGIELKIHLYDYIVYIFTFFYLYPYLYPYFLMLESFLLFLSQLRGVLKIYKMR